MKSIITGAWAARWNNQALFLLRVAVGLVFFMHGWQKWQGGLAKTTGFLDMLHFPMPEVFAVILIATEVIGGAAIILGAYTRLAATFTSIVAAVAFLTVHMNKGFFVSGGGYEFIVLIFAASFLVLVMGPGSWSVDKKLLRL